MKNGVYISKIRRLTALWALSEAALGGILHALHIPLTGLFVNGTAVIFISLIGFYSKNRGDILRSMFIVMLIKAGVAPYTPPAAYFAVSLQGILGEILFRPKKLYPVSAVLFGTLTLALSSIQRFLMLTIVYGKNLWESIDSFGSYVSSQFHFIGNFGSLSLWIMGIYSGVHIFSGFMIGLFSSSLPSRIARVIPEEKFNVTISERVKLPEPNKKKKRKRGLWFRKPTAIVIFILALIIVILSYIYPGFSRSMGTKAIIMILRSVVIMTVWFFLISPFIRKLYKKFFKRKKNLYKNEIDFIVSVLPDFKSVVYENWKKSEGMCFVKRFEYFTVRTLANILNMNIENREHD